MKKLTAITLLLSCLACLPRAALSRQQGLPSRYVFSAMTVDDGLPHNYVDDIYKDSRGFLWISTGGGLVRHDGHDMLLFNTGSAPVSLKSNAVKKVCEDDFRRLWVISSGGLDVIDLFTMHKDHALARWPAVDHARDLSLVNIFKDKKGNLWLHASEIIYKISFDPSGTVRQVDSTDRRDASPFTTLREVDGTIYAAYNGKIFTVAASLTGGLTLQRAFTPVDFGDDVHVSTLVKKENAIWIGTENGLFRYNLNNNSLDAFVHDERDPGSISQNMVTDILVRDDGQLIVATLLGLNFFDISSDTFERVSAGDDRDGNTLNNDFINCLLADGNLLWIGTEAGGINKMAFPRLAVRAYVHHPDDPGSLSKNLVNAILEDHDGNLWVGTIEGGLNCKRVNEERFTRYTAGRGNLVHNSVSALEEDDRGRLWVGTWGGGISVLDANKSPAVTLENITLATNYVGILRHDTLNDGTWIGTNRDIYFYDARARRVRQPLSPRLTRNIHGTLGSLIDREGRLWLGTTAGLLEIDLSTLDEARECCDAAFFATGDQRFDRTFLPKVSCLHEAHDGAIWLGSDGYGICRLVGDRGNRLDRVLTTSDGLANNTVFGILEDEQGLLWISTARGLSCYNPASSLFANYVKDDGLINNQFYWNAAYKSPANKRLYFGGVNGLTSLDPNQEVAAGERPAVTFTRLQVSNKTISQGGNRHLREDISYARRVDLHEGDNSFSIEFSALDQDSPSTVVYAYRLIGFDDRWITAGAARRFASYTNLRPGAYKLQVKSMSRGEDATGNVAEMEIVVHPFFYKTAWFIALLVFLAAALVLRVYRWRVSALKRQQKILQEKVEDRTRALEQQKQLLERQALELQHQNDALKSQNEKIFSQRGQLLEMSEKVQEAMADRVDFFTNITHEFRTPLTLVTGPVERALKLSTNPRVIEQLQLARRNSKHLLSLVNQLMDFRKVESGNISVSLKSGNLPACLHEILIPLAALAAERHVTVREVYHLDPPTLFFDEEVIHKLITNLVANAIKFTPDHGRVTLYARTLPGKRSGKERLYLCVRDSGTGIKEGDLARVFDRFFQSRGNVPRPVPGQGGTGIGLYLCKSLVTLLGGTIRAKNNRGRGASFRVLLPLARGNISVVSARVAAPPRTVAGDPENDRRRRSTILVVEDNADMQNFIVSILRDHYRIERADNGQQALDILKNKHVDLIISDLMMPVMDGLELSRRVKADFSISHVPFLMLTAKSSDEARVASYKTGVDDFLTKPFDEEMLLARVHNVIERREEYRRRFSPRVALDELNVSEESADKKFLRRAVEVLKANYKNPSFDVGEFVDAMQVSKSLLNKKMQILAGRPAGHFIRDYRLGTAREMMRKEVDLTISEIAYAVGFNDPKYFTRCFTRHFGVAPSQLKEESVANDEPPETPDTTGNGLKD
ncbi:MAG: response regulator [Odoribacteraceae bacterium]|jgi:signal transduction histidine kinase/ligand-binding sensor domain-containing protein/DNA-binding response OmpR family regulator|nr:response regulator [Odoribacteraceae bacterium]